MEKPSQITKGYWVYAINKKRNTYPKSTDNCGKWIIFAYKGEGVDRIWDGVRRATEKGLLGNSSKCSTMKEEPEFKNKNTGVICVYTYDSKDKDDLKRIAKELFKIPNVEKLYYKEDKATYEGKYAHKGDKKISRWFVNKDNFLEVLT